MKTRAYVEFDEQGDIRVMETQVACTPHEYQSEGICMFCGTPRP